MPLQAEHPITVQVTLSFAAAAGWYLIPERPLEPYRFEVFLLLPTMIDGHHIVQAVSGLDGVPKPTTGIRSGKVQLCDLLNAHLVRVLGGPVYGPRTYQIS